jgi:glutamate dehydrogenase (NADP+)
MGGGKGGANFNPKGKSDSEVMRFCQSFMTELYRHIGADTDVPPATSASVRAKSAICSASISASQRVYRRADRQGPGIWRLADPHGGNRLWRRLLPAEHADPCRQFRRGQDRHHLRLRQRRHARGREGSAAWRQGADPVDSEGFVHDPDGITQEKVEWVKTHKTKRRGRIADYAQEFKGATFHAGERPWGVPCDIALPCATQNELNGKEAELLVKNGCMAVSEGANMPTDLDGVHVFKKAQILYAPGKAPMPAALPCRAWR